ncbi:tyrosine-type recombinase/integrase [Methylobacterium sp. J-092]|uniref:tyrosine-type recombinase/integrase n=1 Tax=Methylobacterium sp. J-092 TaxID=2836667 RepID=UPI001FB9F501|nr:tyrosine-type recombinase/integrase [Methylobacterium sp. J-092]MCJ2009551.1 tyrosine-type recombinase/integrase [Methylobacterium sp. J-092]
MARRTRSSAWRSAVCLSAQPKLSDLDDTVLQGLVATFRHRKLAADEARRRGADPLSREGFEALGREIASREAELRDANARGDCTATHFDFDAMMTVLDAGLNIAFGSLGDRRLHLAFVEAELDVMTIVKDRHSGNTRPTPSPPTKEDLRMDAVSRPKQERIEAPSPEQILEGWKTDQAPTEKTFYTFSSKVRRWTAFLAERGVTFESACLSDASDWKIASLVDRSAKSVSNDLYAVKAIYGWAVANGKCPVNPFTGLKQPKAAVKGQRRSTKRDFTDAEAVCILKAARDRTGYRRWVPWIACFTGARISEICQLERADIITSKGMHYFRMTTEYDHEGEGTETSDMKKTKKNLKNHSSKRIIPVHSRLIREGFLDFISRSNSRDLFSDATPDRFGNRGGNATKVISRWVREKLEIKDSRISPSHSFRHRFSTLCKNFGVPPEIRDRLMGHSSCDASELYGEDYSIQRYVRRWRRFPHRLDSHKSLVWEWVGRQDSHPAQGRPRPLSKPLFLHALHFVRTCS